MTLRKMLLGTIAALIALTGAANASYTECSVSKEISLATRPGGPSEPRYETVNKGDKVAYRGSHQKWWFVMHATDGGADYGWVPQNVLTNCKAQDGTP
jgi:hypothetical protein